jgi:hypothetical protein
MYEDELSTATKPKPTRTRQAPLMSTRMVADQLGVSARTPPEWRRRGIGPRWFRVGRLVRYRAEDVAAFIRDCESGETELLP